MVYRGSMCAIRRFAGCIRLHWKTKTMNYLVEQLPSNMNPSQLLCGKPPINPMMVALNPTAHRLFSSKLCIVCAFPTSSIPAISRTQRIMESIDIGLEAGGAGGSSSYAALRRADELWQKIKCGDSAKSRPDIVKRYGGKNGLTDEGLIDVVICGGTLGIFLATSLVMKGLKVAVIEKGRLQGRVQEWNISKKELLELVDVGVLDKEDLEDVIAIEFNPNRCGFASGSEVWVKDILNLGVSPLRLIAKVKSKYLDLGGLLLEGKSVRNVDIFDDCSVVTLDDDRSLSSKLVVDAMGSFSSIVQQIRWGQKPDGICLVVGTCARGFENNSTGDMLYSNSPITDVRGSQIQYFWEAFPAGSGPSDRTTYMFSYMDATPGRPSLEHMLEDYWDLMPKYQDIKLENIQILRVMFGIFPTYRTSPLPAAFDRLLQVGDASGIQSPISFGGFGSLTRHIRRLSTGIVEGIHADAVDAGSLALLNPYLPNLSGAWLLQRAMSVRPETNISANFINELLSVTFDSMERLGDPVLRPFLQDVIQFGPLAKTMGFILLLKPGIIFEIFKQVGFGPIVDWLVHFVALGAYTLAWHLLSSPLQSVTKMFPLETQYKLKRQLEAWQYGSGLDYVHK